MKMFPSLFWVKYNLVEILEYIHHVAWHEENLVKDNLLEITLPRTRSDTSADGNNKVTMFGGHYKLNTKALTQLLFYWSCFRSTDMGVCLVFNENVKKWAQLHLSIHIFSIMVLLNHKDILEFMNINTLFKGIHLGQVTA